MTRLNELGQQGFYVFESLGILNALVPQGGKKCVTGALYSFEYDERARPKVLNMTKIGSGIDVDDRDTDNVRGYYYTYQDSITVYSLSTDEDGLVTRWSSASYGVDLSSTGGEGPDYTDIDIYWGFIISGIVLLLIVSYTGGLYWYSEHKKDDDDDDYLN